MTIAELDDDLQLITDSQDVEPINRTIDGGADFDGFLVRTNEYGEYTACYGFYGIPYNHKAAYSVSHLMA